MNKVPKIGDKMRTGMFRTLCLAKRVERGGSTAQLALRFMVVTWIGLVGIGHGQELNTLTQAQKDSGWVLLFDGRSLFGWHKKQETVTASSWVLNDNAISRGTGGNLYSPATAESFEFSIDWKLQTENGNSGIWLRMIETLPEAQRSGPEIQICGKQHGDYSIDKRTVGACYMMYHPNPAPDNWVKPAGQWNNFRVIMNGKHVEHWGNGVKMVEYEIGSADWLARQSQAEDRIKNPRYGEVHHGSFVLTDHSTPIWYRNIRVRPLGGTQLRSAFPGFTVPPPTALDGRFRIVPKSAVHTRNTAIEEGARIFTLDGRSYAQAPELSHGASIKAIVTGKEGGAANLRIQLP